MSPWLILAADTGIASFDWRILVLFLGVAAVMVTFPRLARRNSKLRRDYEKEYANQTTNLPHIKNQADRILLELVEAGREINSQLDTKMRLLNRLIRDAENVAQRLEQQSKSLTENSAPAVSYASKNQPPEHPTGKTEKEFFDKTVILPPPFSAAESQGVNDVMSKTTIISTPTLPQSSTNSESGRSFARRQKIIDLHRQNFSPRDIAHQLHISLSEVNLVIEMETLLL